MRLQPPSAICHIWHRIWLNIFHSIRSRTVSSVHFFLFSPESPCCRLSPLQRLEPHPKGMLFNVSRFKTYYIKRRLQLSCSILGCTLCLSTRIRATCYEHKKIFERFKQLSASPTPIRCTKKLFAHVYIYSTDELQ
jgi:hypothetical protein